MVKDYNLLLNEVQHCLENRRKRMIAISTLNILTLWGMRFSSEVLQNGAAKEISLETITELFTKRIGGGKNSTGGSRVLL